MLVCASVVRRVVSRRRTSRRRADSVPSRYAQKSPARIGRKSAPSFERQSCFEEEAEKGKRYLHVLLRAVANFR